MRVLACGLTSTAVPGLAAKPILDIDLGIVIGDDLDEIVCRLVEIGYLDRGRKDGGIGHLLVRESAPDIRTVHIHITPYDSEWWRQDLAFREALRADDDLRLRYGKLKSEIAQRHSDSRMSYRRAKSPFIREFFGLVWPGA